MMNTIDAQKDYIKSFEETITKEMKNGKYEQVFVYDSLTSIMTVPKPKVKLDIQMMFKTKVLKQRTSIR